MSPGVHLRASLAWRTSRFTHSEDDTHYRVKRNPQVEDAYPQLQRHTRIPSVAPHTTPHTHSKHTQTHAHTCTHTTYTQHTRAHTYTHARKHTNDTHITHTCTHAHTHAHTNTHKRHTMMSASCPGPRPEIAHHQSFFTVRGPDGESYKWATWALAALAVFDAVKVIYLYR